ncbi:MULTISPECIES: hypothetical protein [unclassified Novosphingobium]|uniref:hypothetical protein n=1 Tax=unclassified Novosphingobium TaxID=2644732 RepID=UPI00146DCD0A|nr:MULTISPECIES: hypothetical protein [unclassified Novosphingobium]NMN06707.1 hypothetical protein [Novosphingobium sp. SG919]NMN88842.1 hypothetical protein [Novosphingobium sp. SG916]
MTDDTDDGGLGGNFDEALFAEVSRTQIADVPTEDSLDPACMIRAVARYLSLRLGGDDAATNCAFVHSPYLISDVPLVNGATKMRHHHLTRSRKHNPFGRVHLVSPGLNEAASEEVDCDDPETLHAWLDARGMLDRPTVWIETASRRMVWYPNGMAGEDAALTLELPMPMPSDIDEAAIDEALRIFHEKVAMIPRSDPKFWHDPGLHVPCQDTEKLMQKALSIALDVHFHDDLVIREYKLAGSVVDFVIHQVGTGEPKPACALELKILREKHHHADAAKASPCAKRTNALSVTNGIEQAAIARDELGTRFAYLAAFDMRATDDDAVMTGAAAKAARLSVITRRYFMFNAKKSYRKATVASQLAKGGAQKSNPRRP